MPSESELAQRLARLRFLGMTQAKTGHPDGRLNAGTNQTWIQTDNERAPTAVYGTVGARNVPVWTREMPDGSRVLDKPDYIIGGVTYGGALETVSQPQLQPVDKGNPVVIPSQNMDAGRVIPSPDGSLYVRVTPYHYPGGYWNGFENILVEPPAGTLNHRIALVGIDYQTAGGTAVGVVSYGQTYATPVPLAHEEAARMAIGTQSVDWRGWLGLTGGQGSVMGSLVYDARWFSPGVFQGTDGTLTSYTGLVPAATIADATKFLRADGSWATVVGGGGSIAATDGTTTVDPASTLTLDGDYFTVTDGGSGDAQVSLKLTATSAGKRRITGYKIYDNTLGAAGKWDVQESSLVTGAGAFADYEWLELLLINAESTVNATADSVYLEYATGGGALDTTDTNYFRNFLAGVNNAVSSAEADDRLIASVAGSSASTPAGYATFTRVTVFDPGSSFHKTAWSENPFRRSAAESDTRLWTHVWENTGAIDRIGVKIDNDPTDQFTAGSRLVIIGYKEEAIGGLTTSAANVSSPPTDAELDTAFGTPATVGNGFSAILDDAGGDSAVYLIASNGTSWWYTSMTKAT